MKKSQLLFILFLVATLGVFTSCEKEDVIAEENLTIDAKDSVRFIYKDKTHLFQLDADGNLDESSIGESFLEVINKGYILELDETNTVYLFDQESEMNVFISENYTSVESSSNKGVATCTTYQHWYYGGFPLAGSGNFSYPSLRPHGFNDIISSAIITNYSSQGYLVRFYKHDNYQGSFYTKIVNPNTVGSIPNFRLYGLNDEISSITGQYL